jgi:hypothetical protein
VLSSLPDLQKERGFPHPSRKKKLLKFKRESTRCDFEACASTRRHRQITVCFALRKTSFLAGKGRPISFHERRYRPTFPRTEQGQESIPFFCENHLAWFCACL